MSRLTPTLCAVFLLASALQTASANDVRKIVDHGLDGKTEHFTVQCTNGAEGSVAVNRNTRQTCASTPSP